ncbi:PhoP regulatory network YrbL family protein [Yoonia sp. F2084L]|nr:PhoP regulatory network YrbL family protein [Yoonia sp. F2084L]
MMPSDTIDLLGVEPLAAGGDHWIYQHPAFADQLIKVMKPSKKVHNLRRPSVRRFKQMRVWQREIAEYIASLAHNGGHCDRLVRQFGFCDTSLGPGMIVGRLNGPDGALAPQLETVLRDANTSLSGLEALREDANALFDTLRDIRVDWEDVTPMNALVTGGDAPRLVIIDGLGSPAFFPTTHISDRIFDAANERRRAKMLRWINGTIAHRSADEAAQKLR